MKVLTTKEVAEMFKVSEKTVTQGFIREGLNYIAIGSKDYRYLEEDVEEFAKAKRKNTSEVLQAYTRLKTARAIKQKGKLHTDIIDYANMRIL